MPELNIMQVQSEIPDQEKGGLRHVRVVDQKKVVEEKK